MQRSLLSGHGASRNADSNGQGPTVSSGNAVIVLQCACESRSYANVRPGARDAHVRTQPCHQIHNLGVRVKEDRKGGQPLLFPIRRDHESYLSVPRDSVSKFKDRVKLHSKARVSGRRFGWILQR